MLAFSEEEKGKLTVAQLKFYLKCRGISQNGNFEKETVGKVGVNHPDSRDRSAVYVVYFQLQEFLSIKMRLWISFSK